MFNALILRFLRRRSLRQRFLVVPTVGILVVAIFAAVALNDVQHRNAVLERVIVHDMVFVDRGHALVNQMMRDHLNQQKNMPGASVQGSTQSLDRAIQQDLSDLDQWLNATQTTVADSDSLDNVSPSSVVLQRQRVEQALADYRAMSSYSSTPGTGMARAISQDPVANERFRTLCNAFVGLIEQQNLGIQRALRQQMIVGMNNSGSVLGDGALIAIGLLLLAYGLSRLLSNDLDRQLTSLTSLSETVLTQAHDLPAPHPQDTIGRFERAIAVFRNALHQLTDNDRMLAITNGALVSTLEQLDRTRADLEIKFEARTEDLRLTNVNLVSEIGRRQEVEQSLLIYAEAIRSTGEAVVITDGAGRVLELNPAYEAAVGADAKSLLGRFLFDSLSDAKMDVLTACSDVVTPDSEVSNANVVRHTEPTIAEATPPAEKGMSDAVAAAFSTTASTNLWADLRRKGHWSGETRVQREDGSAFPCLLHANAVGQRDDNSKRFVVVLRDITRLKQIEQDLTQLAFHDPLTSLPNRTLFNHRLHEAVAQTHAGAGDMGVMFMDLDRFKDVNDTLGHPAGDALLKEVAQRLIACVRGTDTLARLGGDEFTVLLMAPCTRQDAEAVAQRIIAAVEAPIHLNGHRVSVGASLGLSFYNGRDSMGRLTASPSEVAIVGVADMLQQHADLALYDAKEHGRGHYRCFTPELLDRSDRRLSLSAQIDQAIQHQGFELYYQPIVNVLTGTTQSVEALIRWKNDNGAWVAPDTFIPHAEDTGFIQRIDTWVLMQACSDARAWVSNGRNLGVSVNLSALSLQSDGTVDLVASALRQTGLPARYLSIEVTETAMIDDTTMARSVLERIAALGVGISLDDFGTGHSSLIRLMHFPVRTLKLDRSFVERIGLSAKDDDVVRSIFDVAKRLDLYVIAEGVEHAHQQAFLVDAGCALVQGFHIGRPMPNHVLDTWLLDGYLCAPLMDQAAWAA